MSEELNECRAEFDTWWQMIQPQHSVIIIGDVNVVAAAAWLAWQAAWNRRAAPEGWQLVPKEPTPEMLFAGQHAWLEDRMRRSTTLYRAMLAAAPKPEGA